MSRIIGVIYSVVVPGLDEKHYDLIFTDDKLIAVYLGEYARVSSQTGLPIKSDLQVYRILKKKRERKYKEEDLKHLCKEKENIVIPYTELSLIKIKKSTSPHTKRMKDKEGKHEFVELILRTNRGLFDFKVSIKAYDLLKRMVNYVDRVKGI